MLNGATNWVWKHRRKIVGVSIAAAGTYTAYVVWKKKRELEDLCSELLSAAPEGRSREEKVREHFEAAQHESDLLLARELPRIQEKLAASLDTDGFRKSMRDDGAHADVERWNELRVLSATRAITSLYAFALALLLRRVHMNIVARHYVLEKEEREAGGGAGPSSAGGLNNITKRRFLSRELGSEVLDALTEAVRRAVVGQLEGLALDRPLSAEDVARDLVCATQKQLEEPGSNKAGVLAPIIALLLDGMRGDGAVADGDQLGALLREARDSPTPHTTAPRILTPRGTSTPRIALCPASSLALPPLPPPLPAAQVREIVGSEPFRIVLGDLVGRTCDAWTEQLCGSLGGADVTRPFAKCAVRSPFALRSKCC